MDVATFGVGVETGIALGGVYAIVGLAFNLIYAATRLFIFCLEAVVALGGILTYVVMEDWGGSWLLAVVLCVIVGVVVGACLDLVCRRMLVGRAREFHAAVLLVSIGLSIAADAALGLTFGASPKQVPGYVTSTPFYLGDVPVQWSYVVIFGVAVAIAVVVEIILRATRTGHWLRVIQDDVETAQLLGIRVGVVNTGVFVVAGVLACVAGFLVTPISGASSQAGVHLILPAFVALALGGFGSFRGAVVGGLVVGLIDGIAALYLEPPTVTAMIFAIVVVVLLIRPIGLFGRPEVLREV
jgi:branched-chain amino acid transport system permease protein